MTAFLLTEGNLRNTDLAQQRHRCLNNIKIQLKEVGRGGVYCTDEGKITWRARMNKALNLAIQ